MVGGSDDVKLLSHVQPPHGIIEVPRSHILRARWVLTWKSVGTEKVPKARLCALGFQDPRLTTLPTASPTLTLDGESAILQWIANEGHLLESGDNNFLSGRDVQSFEFTPTSVTLKIRRSQR